MYHQNQTTADIGPREFFGIHSTKSPLHNQGRLIAWNKNSRFRQREIFVYMSILTRYLYRITRKLTKKGCIVLPDSNNQTQKHGEEFLINNNRGMCHSIV